MRDEALREFRELNEVVERLRAPGGCPWDHEQTHDSLRQYLLEEAYETLEAIEAHHPASLREELGDLLLQVLMHSAIAMEDAENGFDIGDVAETATAKMINRHPHVFADTQVGGAEEVIVNWERLKAQEKGERLSVLDGVPRTLPALAFALGIQKRPARLGFDLHPTLADALTAIDQALIEVETTTGSVVSPPVTGAPAAGHAPSPPAPDPALERAVGSLLFAAVALARRVRVNPEDALRRRALEFGATFRALEAGVRVDGDVHTTPATEWRRRWEQQDADAPA